MPLLENIVISKKILRTRKIMVMHSNERGECCLCTLVDQKWKRYDNSVDVVVRLHDPTDPRTKSTAPPRSAHVRLGDVLAFSIQQEGQVVDEFRQHDGVVTVLVKNNLRRASPKQYENYDGG